MLQTPGSNATRVIGLLYLRQTHGLLCKAQGPKGVRENWCSRVPLNFYLEIGDFCGSHQGHSALSTTAFAVPGDLLQGNWLFQCQCHLLRWERLVRVVPGKAALPLQSSSSKLSHFSLSLSSWLACSVMFCQQRVSEAAAGASSPGPWLCLLCLIHHQDAGLW